MVRRPGQPPRPPICAEPAAASDGRVAPATIGRVVTLPNAETIPNAAAIAGGAWSDPMARPVPHAGRLRD